VRQGREIGEGRVIDPVGGYGWRRWVYWSCGEVILGVPGEDYLFMLAT
jgi:hypothetical protein